MNIGVIGLGYVGLPLAVELGKKYNTVGYDINKKRVQQLKKNKDLTKEVSETELIKSSRLKVTNNREALAGINFYIVTVPTPITKDNRPDLSAIISATELISKYLDHGDIVVYESTVYPGLVEEVCVPILSRISGLSFNSEFSVGYSPERINPGDKKHKLVNIQKIVSASNSIALEKIDGIYKSIIKAGTFRASSIKVAEAAKVIENTQRDLNIAFVNELSIIFDKLGIDTNEVLEAADTKWNFMKFTPGLVGGHCIGVDPYYLTHKAIDLGIFPKVIVSGRDTNDQMHNFLIKKIHSHLTKNKKTLKNMKILVLGFTFKENCPDIRNTRVENLVYALSKKCSSISIFDPIADFSGFRMKSGNIKIIKTLPKSFNRYDGLIAAVPHAGFKKMINNKNFIENFEFILDIKNLIKLENKKIIRM